MCGIAGFMDNENNVKEYKNKYPKMLETMAKRGPDENGLYLDEHLCLLHARLAVVDLEHGKQPMVFAEDGVKYVLVYNGELYNTEEIRAQLVAKGHSFRGHSDTEVLLHAYMEWKQECAGYFNGIFAFAVYNAHTEELFCARDRMGVKPFFYATPGSGFLFASEIKTLLAHPLCEAKIDHTAIAEIMLVGPGRTPGYGIFKGIQELLPGHCCTFSRQGLSIFPYWTLQAKDHNDSFEETVEKVRFLVTDAIKRQTVSDVPLCSFLSGGLDSSAIAAIANIKNTFSVDYVDNEKYFKASKFQPNSDNYYIQQMAGYLGSTHQTIIVETEELADALTDAVLARDLPGMADVDSSLLLFCREVKKQATVALSGECADEVFGGYPWYRDPEIRSTDGFPWAQSTQYRASFLQDEWLAYFDPKDYVYEKYNRCIQNTPGNSPDSPLEKRMKEMFSLNIHWFMQTLLDRKDRMSMYNGLEVRVPFCDHRIVEYLYNVPWEMKDYQGREKGLLRMALDGILPDEVLWRKKSPYPKTHHPAYLALVSSRLQDLIGTPGAPLWQIIKKDAAKALLQDQRAVPWYGQLMTTPQTIAYLLQINIWLEHYKISIV